MSVPLLVSVPLRLTPTRVLTAFPFPNLLFITSYLLLK